jgi:hypothetical protein
MDFGWFLVKPWFFQPLQPYVGKGKFYFLEVEFSFLSFLEKENFIPFKDKFIF